jgi:hypothetical protein
MKHYIPYKGRYMTSFKPHLEILPAPQLMLWEELHQTPEHFTLYGGTALALHLGHRESVDFDFFSNKHFDVDSLVQAIPYLADAKMQEVAKNSLTCRVDRGGAVKMQFLGGLLIGRVEPCQEPNGCGIWVASLLDVAASKMKVIPVRSEQKDYIDVYALLEHGLDLPTMLAAAKLVYGPSFNPVLSLKALSYFGDVPELPESMQKGLSQAAAAVDLTKLPVIKSYEAAHAKGYQP